MTIHAGEIAQESGEVRCQKCNAVVRIFKGKPVPECPAGHKTYGVQAAEPLRKAS